MFIEAAGAGGLLRAVTDVFCMDHPRTRHEMYGHNGRGTGPLKHQQSREDILRSLSTIRAHHIPRTDKRFRPAGYEAQSMRAIERQVGERLIIGRVVC